MYRRKFDNLNRKLAFRKEKALGAVKIAQMEFYIELTKELYKSNKLDCSRESDKCRRKRVSYMGIFMYLLITLFCGYMAFELGRYVIATGDSLPIIIVILLALLSIHCIKQIYKAIKNKDLDILD